MEKVKCKICGEEFSLRSLGNHVKRSHNIKSEEYYIDFIKESVGCLECGKPTRFRGIDKGYRKFCSLKCAMKNPEVRVKIETSMLENHGVINPMHDKNIRDKCINGLNKTLELHKNEIVEKREKSKEIKYGNRNFNNRTKAAATRLELYGDENYSNREKCEETCLKKYGGKAPTSSKEVVELRKKNNIEKYGVDEPAKLESMRIKASKKSSERIMDPEYKKIWYDALILSRKLKGPEIINKVKETNNKNNGVDWPMQNRDIVNKARKSYLITFRKRVSEQLKVLNLSLENGDKDITYTRDIITLKCDICGKKFRNRWYNITLGRGRCPKCFPANKPSRPHMELADYIKSLGFEVSINDRSVIYPLEVDIFIPNKNLCIEMNGLYWHSLKDEKYHKNKTDACKVRGYRLIHIYQDEWDLKKEIIMSTVRYLLGVNNSIKIMARKCNIKEISVKDKNNFLNKNHILGEDKSNIRIGAFYKNNLVSVMTFSYGNISRGGSPGDKKNYEMSRFCVDRDYLVSGAAGKILKYFQNNYEWQSIYTYADLRWSNGDLYEKLGFTKISYVKPSYFYISKNGQKRIHRFQLRKTKDDPSDKPEWLLRSSEGFRKVYDCGKIKYELRRDQQN
jgi:hypothetical protein